MSGPNPLSDRDLARLSLSMNRKLYASHGLDTSPILLDAARGPLGSAGLDMKISQARSYGASDRVVADIVDRDINPYMYRP